MPGARRNQGAGISVGACIDMGKRKRTGRHRRTGGTATGENIGKTSSGTGAGGTEAERSGTGAGEEEIMAGEPGGNAVNEVEIDPARLAAEADAAVADAPPELGAPVAEEAAPEP